MQTEAKRLATCADCADVLGPKYYSDVPGVGDLCLPCQAVRFPPPTKSEPGVPRETAPAERTLEDVARKYVACVCSNMGGPKIGVRIQCRACKGWID